MYMYILAPFMDEVLSQERQWNGWEFSKGDLPRTKNNAQQIQKMQRNYFVSFLKIHFMVEDLEKNQSKKPSLVYLK